MRDLIEAHHTFSRAMLADLTRRDARPPAEPVGGNSGGPVGDALGALHAGATAEAAVLAAIEHSQWAHGSVRSIKHKGVG